MSSLTWGPLIGIIMYMGMAKHIMKLQRRWDREMGALRDRGKKKGEYGWCDSGKGEEELV